MTQKLHFDYSKALSFIGQHEVDYLTDAVRTAHEQLHNGTGAGSDYLGWIDLPVNYDKEEFDRIQKAAKQIQSDSEALVVIGIGGSYLGARAAIEMLSHSFYNNLPHGQRKTPAIYYAGNNISSTYLTHLLQLLEGKDFSVNVISKSGTTTEPAIAFRIFRDVLENKYGKEAARKRIYATTDASKGALRTLADEEGYETFIIPDDVGGRYSVLTAVGLLPIAAAGIDIEEMMKGAADARVAYSNPDLKENESYQYAAVRNALYRKGKGIEILVNYEPSLHFVSEWWKQLYGESEGKDYKGIYPASVDFFDGPALHGPIYSGGEPHAVRNGDPGGRGSTRDRDRHGSGKSGRAQFPKRPNDGFRQQESFPGYDACPHGRRGAEPDRDASRHDSVHVRIHGLLFFEKACGISGYLLGVNPFDQPGVEAYKKEHVRFTGQARLRKAKGGAGSKIKRLNRWAPAEWFSFERTALFFLYRKLSFSTAVDKVSIICNC